MACRFCFLVLLLLSIVPGFSQVAGQGIFANFQTSAGKVRVKLDYERAPLTVANFVGLVEGSQQALDPRNARVVAGKYYDGMIFHRVIKDFMIQTGSPKGDGRDGPGYTFRDEFHKDLRHKPYVISMANSGPNTNGSQFFITTVATAWLNDKHSVFGEVVEGKDVVLKISEVTTVKDKPTQEVRLETVRIERVGGDAQGFKIQDRGLPTVGHLPVQPTYVEGKLNLAGDFALNRVYTLYASTDLITWQAKSFPVLTDAPLTRTDVSDFAAKTPRHYFRVAEVRYPEFLSSPDVLGRTIILRANEFDGEAVLADFILRFDQQNGAVVQLDDFKSTANNYFYQVDGPAKSTLIVPSQLPAPFSLMQIKLSYIDKTKGTFLGVLPRAVPPTEMAGTFNVQ